MTAPAPDTKNSRARGPKALFGLAWIACVACCVLPALIAAGLIGGSATLLVGWLPGVALALAAAAAGLWWLQRRKTGACSCRTGPAAATASGCGCAGR
jgi:mercuric ion transport protein